MVAVKADIPGFKYWIYNLLSTRSGTTYLVSQSLSFYLSDNPMDPTGLFWAFREMIYVKHLAYR